MHDWRSHEILPKKPQDLTMNGRTELCISIDSALATEDAAIVRLRADLDDEAWTTTASARRDPTDKANSEAALLLATSRALNSMSRHFERQAEGKIKHDDDMRIRHRELHPLVTVPASLIAHPIPVMSSKLRRRAKRKKKKFG